MEKTSNQMLFCKAFSFICDYFQLTPNEISNVQNIDISIDSLYSWRTRSCPGAKKFNNQLLPALMLLVSEKKQAINSIDFAIKIKSVLEPYGELPPALSANPLPDLEDLVEAIMVFCFLYGRSVPNEKARVTDSKEHEVRDPSAKTEAVVFSFDVMLGEDTKFETTWEAIWETLGLDINKFHTLYADLYGGKISYGEWCKINETFFRSKKLRRDDLVPLLGRVHLIDGLEDVLKHLEKRDIKVYIDSGSIKFIIQKSLGALCGYITGDINANDFDFDQEGFFVQITPTDYDFEGKSNRLFEIAKRLHARPDQILFIGNSPNDEWAHSSGSRTLAINPINTNVYNKAIWDDYILNCKSLIEILRFI